MHFSGRVISLFVSTTTVGVNVGFLVPPVPLSLGTLSRYPDMSRILILQTWCECVYAISRDLMTLSYVVNW